MCSGRVVSFALHASLADWEPPHGDEIKRVFGVMETFEAVFGNSRADAREPKGWMNLLIVGVAGRISGEIAQETVAVSRRAQQRVDVTAS